MRNDLYYYTIDKIAFAEFKDKGSRFIAYAYPITKADDFKKYLQVLKKEHPKAVHHCFAYQLGLDGNTFRVNDDGEPGGTAGRPILSVINSNNLTNILIIVVRYFGGTLLGAPGLINAYKSASAMALQVIPFVQKSVEICYELQFDYTKMNDVMMVLKQYLCSIIMQDNQLFCIVQTGIPKARLDEVLAKLKDLHTVVVKKLVI
ncbi:MAG: YigZ family protein [Deinococcales bacterium]|nr:YigZ family protein [Chitinophagaceae bacterium]